MVQGKPKTSESLPKEQQEMLAKAYDSLIKIMADSTTTMTAAGVDFPVAVQIVTSAAVGAIAKYTAGLIKFGMVGKEFAFLSILDGLAGDIERILKEDEKNVH